MTAVKDLVRSRSTGGGAVGVEFDTLPLQQHRWVDTSIVQYSTAQYSTVQYSAVGG